MTRTAGLLCPDSRQVRKLLPVSAGFVVALDKHSLPSNETVRPPSCILKTIRCGRPRLRADRVLSWRKPEKAKLSEIIGHDRSLLRQSSLPVLVGILERLNRNIRKRLAGIIEHAAGYHARRGNQQSNTVDVRTGIDGECETTSRGPSLSKGGEEISTASRSKDIRSRRHILKFESAINTGRNSQWFGTVSFASCTMAFVPAPAFLTEQPHPYGCRRARYLLRSYTDEREENEDQDSHTCGNDATGKSRSATLRPGCSSLTCPF